MSWDIELIDEKGNLCENIFDRIKVMPDPSTPKEFPKYTTQENLDEGLIAFRQVLPYQEPHVYNIEKGQITKKIEGEFKCMNKLRSKVLIMKGIDQFEVVDLLSP